MELERELTRQIAATEEAGESDWVYDLVRFKARCIKRRVALEAATAPEAGT